MTEEKSHDVVPRGWQRRDFLGAVATGGVAGAAAIGSSGCSSMVLRGLAREAGSGDIEALFARLDAGLGEIDSNQVSRRAIEQLMGSDALDDVIDEDRELLDQGDELGRRMLRSLLVAGMVHDLPSEVRTSPEVRCHLERYGPELDETVMEATRLIGGCPRSARQEVGQFLRERPELAMEMGQILDDRSAEVGLGSGGRNKLRQTCTHLTGRLRRQPPSLLVDECLDKMERDLARHGLDVALWRQLTAGGALHALWGPAEPWSSRAKWAESAAEIPLEEPSVEEIPQESTESLIQALQSDDLAERVAAIRALGDRRSVEAIPALGEILQNDPSPLGRGWALRALRHIGTPEARAAVEPARRDPDERVRALVDQLAPRPQAPPVRQAPAVERPPAASDAGDERQRRLRHTTMAMAVAGNVVEGVGLITLIAGVASGTIEGLYVMTAGSILLGLGFIFTIVGLILYGIHRRRQREGRGR
jgi:hypothetical protein